MLIIGMANVVNACLDRGEGSPRRLAFFLFIFVVALKNDIFHLLFG